MRTKIIASIGPSSKDPEMFSQMIDAGLVVARFNFSHGRKNLFKKWAEEIRKKAGEKEKSVALLCDLQGPKIRLGRLPGRADFLNLKEGEEVFLTTREEVQPGELCIRYKNFLQDVKEKQKVLINDGKIELIVKENRSDGFSAIVSVPGKIAPFQGVNLPQTDVTLPLLRKKDIRDLRFALKIKVDAIGLSFVRTAADIRKIKELILEYREETDLKEMPWIVAKIERREAVENVDEIIKEADVVMVARGDLGIEMPETEVPLLQKQIIEKCIIEGKPVITATQMLDSMQENPRPTRAEVSDVANAIIDGSDAVMLSGETTTGKYPLEAVTEMKKIIEETEEGLYEHKDIHRYSFHHKKYEGREIGITDAVGESSCEMAAHLGARYIVCATGSGHTARMIAKCRSEVPILALTPSRRTYKLLNFVWGVEPHLLPGYHTTDELLTRSIDLLKQKGLVKSGNKLVITAGHPVGEVGNTNLIKVEEVT